VRQHESYLSELGDRRDLGETHPETTRSVSTLRATAFHGGSMRQADQL